MSRGGDAGKRRGHRRAAAGLCPRRERRIVNGKDADDRAESQFRQRGIRRLWRSDGEGVIFWRIMRKYSLRQTRKICSP